MPPTSRTRVALLVAGVMAATVAASPLMAEASGCRPTPNVLGRTPTTRPLPGGATMRVWDTGPTPSDPQASTRIVAVRVPASSPLTAHVRATSRLTRSETPATQAGRRPAAVVTINGSVFDPVRRALPLGPAIVGGRVLKGTPAQTTVLGQTSDGRLTMANLFVTGRVTLGGTTRTLVGLNQQSVAGGGVTVYTPAWGGQHRPYGTVDLVVSSGTVTAVRTGTSRGSSVPSGAVVVTATGATGTSLAHVRAGTPATVRYAQSITYPKPYDGPLVGALGRGTRLVRDGANGVTCVPDSRDELLRPRTTVGWTAGGDLLLVTFQGRATVNGVRYGGATVHQLGDYLRRLGATQAVNLDGGGSTTMVVRTTTGATPTRVDRGSRTDAQRPVPTVVTLEL